MRRALPWILLLAVAALVFAFRDRIHFDWATVARELLRASLLHILAGTALIYATYFLRSVRWAIFLAPIKRVSPARLLAPQFIGFTAVALFGRLADLSRPFLVARRVDLPLSSQVAVYTVERMFDLGSAAVIFSAALLFTPREMPHHEVFLKAGPLALAITLAAALFVLAIRLQGERLATLFARVPKLGPALAEKILGFRTGLNVIRSAPELLLVTLISLTMWFMIGLAYQQTAHAFVATPELAHVTFASTMLLMAASIGGSALQLPIIGWFTQIAVTAGAMHTFYDAPLEAATACGAALLFVTFLSIIPAGLLFARATGISLRDTTRTAESATL